MNQILSERASRLLRTWERRPYVEDLGLVRAAIAEAGLPVTDPVIAFHRTFAGYVADVWGEAGPLGIIHPRVTAVESWSEPMKVGGYLKSQRPLLACADVHVSWEMMIALNGTFWCNGPESSSYFLWTEQCAFQQEFFQVRRAQVLRTNAAPEWLAEAVLPRLAGFRIDALSDEHCQIYATDEFVVSVGQEGQRYHALVAEGAMPSELADFRRPMELRAQLDEQPGSERPNSPAWAAKTGRGE